MGEPIDVGKMYRDLEVLKERVERLERFVVYPLYVVPSVPPMPWPDIPPGRVQPMPTLPLCGCRVGSICGNVACPHRQTVT